MTPMMEQKIFDLSLPVNATSLYLLCCGLSDQGVTLSLEQIRSTWADSDGQLEEAISLLLDRNILSSKTGQENTWVINPVSQWM